MTATASPGATGTAEGPAGGPAGAAERPAGAVERPAGAAAGSGPSTGRARLNGLDGFRAVAVAVVALFHFGVPGFAGGWIGPELFFVLSGYLITTLLLDRSGAGARPALGDFWVRRVRRLYPALLLLVATLISLMALLDGLHVSSALVVSPAALRSEAVAALAYYANWHLIVAHTGYFGASTSLLKHTWSLAIEEQFYLVWPLVFAAIRRAARWWRPVGLAVAGAGSLASIAYAATSVTGANVNTAYYATQANAFHLLLGVGLAFATSGWAPGPAATRRLGWLALPSLVVIAAFVGAASGGGGAPRLFMFRGGAVLLDLAGAGLVASLVFGDPRGAVSRLFNLRPVVWLGSVSYGVYLWHFPLAVLLTPSSLGLPHAVVVLVLIVATLAAAAFSHRFVEVVVRQRLIASDAARWGIYLVGFAATVALVAAVPLIVRP